MNMNKIKNNVKGMYRYVTTCPSDPKEAIFFYGWCLICLNTILVFILPSNAYPAIMGCFMAEILMLMAFVIDKHKDKHKHIVGD